MKKQRDAQITIIIGRNGTGKSTLCQRIVEGMKTRALAVTYNGAPKIWRPYSEVNIRSAKDMKFKKGIKQVIAARYEVSRHQNDVFQHVYKNYTDGCIVWDDCRGYIHSGVDDNQYFRQLLLDFRHRMLDMIFVVHSPADVPPRVWGFTSTVWVGATDALVNKSQVRTSSADRIINIQGRINKLFLDAKARGDDSHYGLFKKVDI